MNTAKMTRQELIDRIKELERELKKGQLTEKALTESEAQKRAILHGITSNMLFLNDNMEILWANKSASEQLDKSPEEMIGLKCHEYFMNSSKPCNDCPSFKAFKTKKSEHAIMVDPDGRVWDEVGEPVFDDQNRFIGVIDIALEISERKRAEEALRHSEAQKKAILNGITTNIAFINENMEIMWANKSAADQLGLPPEKMIGLNCYRCFMKSEAVCPECPSAKAIKTRKSERALIEGPDGRIWDEIGEPVFDDEGKFIGVVDIAQDITETLKAEEALRESEERLTLALEGANEGLWDWNLETGEVFYSPFWSEMLGYSPNEIKPHINSWKKLMHPQDKPNVLETLDAHLKGEIPLFEIEHRLKTKSGEWKWILTHGRVLKRDKKNKPLRAIGTQINITEIKRTEEELKESRERARNLSAHLQSIREEERARIAREIHDELSQVLTLLQMDLAWLQKRIPRDLKKLDGKINSMLVLANNTLDTVHKIAGKLRPTLLDDLGLVSAIEWEAKEFGKRTGIKYKLALISEEFVIDKDISIALFRIFQEALTNITRHAKATHVDVTLEVENNVLVLKVRDNGTGISEEKIKDSKSFGLMGIQERVLYLRGRADIAGTPGKGTTIRVEVPLEKP